MGRAGLALALAVLAVILSAGALAFTVIRSVSAGPECQTLAWDSIPDDADLPEGWIVGTSNFFVGSMTATLDGPASFDGSGDGSIFATVTCYGSDGAQAIARSRTAETNAGNTVSDVDVGDTGYAVGDDTTGTTGMHFLRDELVAFLAISGTVDEVDLLVVAEAFDQAIRTAQPGSVPTARPVGQSTPPPFEPDPSDDAFPEESDFPEESPVAPELEAMLPSAVDDQPFVIYSASGADLPPDSPGSRSLMASLRAIDRSAEDLEVAEAYDELEALDLYFFAFRLPGEDGAALREMILESWLSANATGVTQEAVTLADRELIRVSYGDGEADVYVYTREDAVILIQTRDADLAEAGAGALP